MDMDSFIGNKRVVETLLKAQKKETLPRSVLFVGPDGIGKKTLAKILSVSLLGVEENKLESNPEFIHILDTSVESIREVREKLSSRSWSGGNRVVLIDGVDSLTLSASNALLKILEEPADNTWFFITAKSIASVIPTIQSRCSIYYFNNVSESEMRVGYKGYESNENFENILCFSSGRPGVFIKLLEDNDLLSSWNNENELLSRLMSESVDERLKSVESIVPKSKLSRELIRNSLTKKWNQWIVILSQYLKDEGAVFPKNEICRAIDTIIKVNNDLERNLQPRALCDRVVLSLPRL